MPRFLILMILATALNGCSSCRQLVTRMSTCDDMVDGWTVDSQTAFCESNYDELTPSNAQQFDCVTQCVAEGACDTYFTRMYLSNYCTTRCQIATIRRDDDDSSY